MVCHRRPHRRPHHDSIGRLVQGETCLRGQPSTEATIAQPRHLESGEIRGFADSRRAGVLEILLHRLHHELLAAFAIGTVAGGMLGDKFGRKYVIWFSILGSAPFALIMPFANLTWTIICTFLSGLIIASAFSSIVVYATDLMPDKVGLIAGIFFGLMFGLGGLGSAFFGWLADKTSIEFIFQVSAFLPLFGIIAGFLPNTQKRKKE